jgi:hypothetical protein
MSGERAHDPLDGVGVEHQAAVIGEQDARAPQYDAKVEAAIRARLVRGEGIEKVANAIGVPNDTVAQRGRDGTMSNGGTRGWGVDFCPAHDEKYLI